MTSTRISKKNDIEQAAMLLFAQNGMDGTTIKEIAKLAGVTEGAIYRHYASKEEMAKVLFNRELDNLKRWLSDSMAAGLDPKDRLKAIVDLLYSAYRETPWPFLFVILNFQNLQVYAAGGDNRHIYDFIIDFTRNLFSSETVDRDYEFLATLVVGVIMQPVIFHFHKKLPKHPVEYVNEVTESCCQLLRLENNPYQ